MDLPPVDIEIASVLTSVTDVTSTSALNNTKISRCIITIWPDVLDDDTLNPTHYQLCGITKNWVGQFENCPTTGRLHAHLYVEFQRAERPRFHALKAKFDAVGMACSIKRSSTSSNHQRQSAVNYCTDPAKRSPNSEVYKWSENTDDLFYKENRRAKAVGRKEQQRLYIESKSIELSYDEILHEDDESKKLLFDCSWGAKYHKSRFVNIEKRTIKDVIIYYGAGGTGKTTMARELNEGSVYRRNYEDGSFWGGGNTAYKNEMTVHFEEFNGQEAFSKLKEICDVGANGPPVNVKNGGVNLNHECVVFTSNHHPAYWYGKLWEKHSFEFLPFWRRITKVYFFPELREDGTRNAPTEEIGPYYIDQTEDWIGMKGVYKSCLKAAESSWPESTEGAFAPGFIPPPDVTTIFCRNR